ncbi:MAG: class I SAM-dependent methyltransferase [Deltaproteobacteria bacterium]|nr:class I SAM-dependent methyltransferase [Deltaproteobacteria bacterium]
MTASALDDRSRWEKRYAAGISNEAAAGYLVQHADRLGGRILDVAGGSGRNAIYLARHGACVDIVDIAFNGLSFAVAVATQERLQLRAVQADLTNLPLPQRTYDAIINFRYLQRSLFASLQDALKPGGLVLFESFLIDQQSVGHPRNPDFLLQRGELRRAFAHFEIVDYWEGLTDEIHPAYVARMLARRPLVRWD